MNIQANLAQLDSVLVRLDSWIERHALPVIILLQGTLGSGKTTLVQHFCQTHHAPQATSPTFSLMHTYPAEDFCIYHYDFYLKEIHELLEMGVLENLECEGVHFVEWGSEALKEMLVKLGFSVLTLKLQAHQEMRTYRFSDG
ncbi:tRNA (adenosine(37)-N6)-threonylcarbamoyltransferase complex ATPase subunit type 1 TsaE [Helicobacter salomonis]|uniref:tRNA (adenosine(37)-N6)-threonylcarbamoyltransferase complex ATPase subunit type 1 TsaE n=1 Tax=Helicobacter salomonis TaxID=56878 RepID=UPI000CF0D55D|nr:tRNA (adenosine(37)-N6)-threonylcarbamoyltransferase complex ATPase subunit type 1 TsaE [Helicobacter salomonis]